MDRRQFLKTLLALTGSTLAPSRSIGQIDDPEDSNTLLLTGDIMTGRGIDQILPHPCPARIHENYMQSALGYVELAERAHGSIPRPATFDYIWGDALSDIDRLAADLLISNLETSITTSDDWIDKGINYRMHPRNARSLQVAGIGCCSLANNHVLDWGEEGLSETLRTLKALGIATTGAGENVGEANSPAIVELPSGGRALVFGVGAASSGIPSRWAASARKPGISYLRNLRRQEVDELAKRVEDHKQAGDIVVVSIHWGSNWSYEISSEQRRFAHQLIDRAGVNVVHGHSSHHPKGIEVHHERPIFYGCGDFLNDYEGIGSREEFRSDLALLYALKLNRSNGTLLDLTLRPYQIRRFRLSRASSDDISWLRGRLDRVSSPLGCRVEMISGSSLVVRWS